LEFLDFKKMKVKAPNYLYPLATERKLQWTKDVVKGEASAFRTFIPKRVNAEKKKIVKDVIKGKKRTFNKVASTRSNLNPMLRANLPEDPMDSPDPRPGNATHITNIKKQYIGYLGHQA
jgi:hypothetical protein